MARDLRCHRRDHEWLLGPREVREHGFVNVGADVFGDRLITF